MSVSISVNSAAQMSDVHESVVHETDVLPGENDEYGGVLVEMKEPMEPEYFAALLRDSMSRWRLHGKKGVWIKLPTEFANLIEPAVKEGFWYHHAEPSYLMLVYWIPQTSSTIPANASHRVGIGAVVLNDKREENVGRFRGTGIWKIPTGVVDEGEDIFVAAVREVKEETGVDTDFMEILGFWQTHHSFFGKSDLFFLCMLRPLSSKIQKQELEIEAAQWMPFEEYAAQPFARKDEFFKHITDICLAKVDKGYTGFPLQPIKPTSEGQQRYLYVNIQDLKSSSLLGHQ